MGRRKPATTNFVHCVKLRNQLVHYTPAFLKPNEVPRDLQSFPAHVIKAPAGQYYWTSVFQTPVVAEWVVDSCGAFARWFQAILAKYDRKNA